MGTTLQESHLFENYPIFLRIPLSGNTCFLKKMGGRCHGRDSTLLGNNMDETRLQPPGSPASGRLRLQNPAPARLLLSAPFRVSPLYKQKPEKTLWVNSGFCLCGSLMIQFENSTPGVTNLLSLYIICNNTLTKPAYPFLCFSFCTSLFFDF